MPITQLVWFRSDLRAADNTALKRAVKQSKQDGSHLRAVYIATPAQWREHHMSAMRTSLIASAVTALNQDLAEMGVPLDVLVADKYSDAVQMLVSHCQQYQVSYIHANREYLVNEIARDYWLTQSGIQCRFYDDSLLMPPESLLSGQLKPYRVFTPFSKAWISAVRAQLPASSAELWEPPEFGTPIKASDIPDFAADLSTEMNKQLSLWPHSGETALDRLREFVDPENSSGVVFYHQQRDFPDLDATSRLSAALSLGLLSPRQCLHQLLQHYGADTWDKNSGAGCWLNELIWREFYQHIAFHFPRVVKGRAFKIETDQVPWLYDQQRLQAWKDGNTGFPIVDAAMRQLKQTGWMHNRLRMISAAFLTKDLHLDWRLGEQHFMENLIDGDFAANNGGWQWAASTGTDAAPYFRVFNPTTQSQRFDPKGQFIRRYVPELAELSDKQIHAPSACPNYPAPIVDHKQARLTAIDMFSRLANNH